MTSDYARAFAEAVAREIRAEMARQGYAEVRPFARSMGLTNHTSVNDRLSFGKARRIPLNTEDLATYCAYLGVDPSKIVGLAEARVRVAATDVGDDIVERARVDAFRRAQAVEAAADTSEADEQGTAAAGA